MDKTLNLLYNIDMECEKCNSSRLKAYHRSNLDYVLNFKNKKWFYANPTIHEFIFYSTPWQVRCLDCFHDFTMPSPKKLHTPAVAEFTEIVFDLDHTLFNVEGSYLPPSGEQEAFKFSDPEGRFVYRVFPRPFLKQLIGFCISRFDRINFFTAATDWYAQELITSLQIPDHKLGFIKTRQDTVRGRPLSFEWEALKKMDNMLVVEDKPLVVEGYNNTIFKVPGFYGQTDDQELANILLYLNQNQQTFSAPVNFSGSIELFLKDIRIQFADLPSSEFKKILAINVPDQSYLDTLPIRTSFFKPYLVFEHHLGKFSFVDLLYKDYLTLYSIIKDYTEHCLLSEEEFSELIQKKANKYRRDF